MAGYLVRADGSERTFHLGANFVHNDANDVVEVQLDGDELEYVRQQMAYLPVALGRVVRYFGDHAKFIIANWEG